MSDQLFRYMGLRHVLTPQKMKYLGEVLRERRRLKEEVEALRAENKWLRESLEAAMNQDGDSSHL